MTQPRFRRPAMLAPEEAGQIAAGTDAASRSEAATAVAHALVTGGRQNAADGALVDRIVQLVDTEGLDLVAELWADSPPVTLAGALWRLYVLREWTRRDPRTIAERYRLGVRLAEVSDAIAGAADTPGPEEIRDLADAILSGVFQGDLAIALERAGAFCRVLATGSAVDADSIEQVDHAIAHRVTRSAGSLLDTAADLERAAGRWRAGRLE